MLQDLIAIKKKGPGGPIGHWGRGTSASLATNIEAIPTTLLPTSENFKKKHVSFGGGNNGFPWKLANISRQGVSGSEGIFPSPIIYSQKETSFSID